MSVLKRTQHEPIGLPLRVFSLIRSLFVLFVSENIFLWSRLLQGRRNPQADVEGPKRLCTILPLYFTQYCIFLGPYYVVGAPDRQLEEGKAILATVDELKGDHNDTIAL